MGSPAVVPDSVALGRLSKPLGGPAFEPLDRNGFRAGFLHTKGIGRREYLPYWLGTGGAPFEAVSWGVETTPAAIVAERGVVDGT